MPTSGTNPCSSSALSSFLACVPLLHHLLLHLLDLHSFSFLVSSTFSLLFFYDACRLFGSLGKRNTFLKAAGERFAHFDAKSVLVKESRKHKQKSALVKFRAKVRACACVCLHGGMSTASIHVLLVV